MALDDELLATAEKWTGIHSKSDLLNFVLKEFIQKEAGRRLAEMGGTMPDLELTPRGPRLEGDPVFYGGKPLKATSEMHAAKL